MKNGFLRTVCVLLCLALTSCAAAGEGLSSTAAEYYRSLLRRGETENAASFREENIEGTGLELEFPATVDLEPRRGCCIYLLVKPGCEKEEYAQRELGGELIEEPKVLRVKYDFDPLTDYRSFNEAYREGRALSDDPYVYDLVCVRPLSHGHVLAMMDLFAMEPEFSAVWAGGGSLYEKADGEFWVEYWLGENSVVREVKTELLPGGAIFHPGNADMSYSTGGTEVTAADARLILRASIGLDTLKKGLQFWCADADEDGEITAADARLALRMAVMLEPYKTRMIEANVRGTVVETKQPASEDPSGGFVSKLCRCGYTTDDRIYENSLNREYYGWGEKRHLPVYRFDTRAGLEDFRTAFTDGFSFGESYDEVPSFDSVCPGYDDAFFAQNTLFLIYIEASSGSFRFDLDGVRYVTDASILQFGAKQTNHPEVFTEDMAGWFLLVELSDEYLSSLYINGFDAVIA
ncbi:MAG: hypothetical protein K6C36_05555 [Clostridia bacterium]|nr:hypothetical protein [Clostridia bacterium]